ncbi:MAG: hypothetical protein AB1413_12450, partial [Thermodesulfobacteriota bacterium]
GGGAVASRPATAAPQEGRMHRATRKKLTENMRAMSRAERLQYLANLRVIWAWRRKMTGKGSSI